MENIRPIGFKTQCETCGALHDEIIKRLKGIVYRKVSALEHDQVVAQIKRHNWSYAESLKHCGYEKVELALIPGTCAPFYCKNCITKVIAHNKPKKLKPESLNGQRKLF